LARDAGLVVDDVRASAPVFRDFALTDKILGLRRNTERAIRAARMDWAAGDRWLAELSAGPFLATFALFTVVVRRPG
jgi:hypothetical protein